MKYVLLGVIVVLLLTIIVVFAEQKTEPPWKEFEYPESPGELNPYLE